MAPTVVGGRDAYAAPSVVERSIARSRVTVGDVVPGAPANLSAIDLGPSPTPGSARIVRREEVIAALPQDVDAKALSIPEQVRVVRKARDLSTAEIEQLVRDAVSRDPLPRGVTVNAVKAPVKGLTVPDGYDRVRVSIPKPPRREARLSSTATLLFSEGDFVVAKAPIPVDLVVSAAAATPDVKKGDRLTLVVKRGLVEIRATVTANADADVGENLQVTVGDSGKALRAKLVSADPPTAEEAS
jgi:flagella basal body P-ring formation protein FlgA